MLPVGFFAVAVSVVCVVLIAVVSMRGERKRKRRWRDQGAIVPGYHHWSDGGDGADGDG